jgi:hypothetical protein
VVAVLFDESVVVVDVEPPQPAKVVAKSAPTSASEIFFFILDFPFLFLKFLANIFPLLYSSLSLVFIDRFTEVLTIIAILVSYHKNIYVSSLLIWYFFTNQFYCFCYFCIKGNILF